jgi:hypothetical protein
MIQAKYEMQAVHTMSGRKCEVCAFRLFRLFAYGVFSDDFSNSDYVTLNGRMLVNYEFGRLWKEVVMAKLEVLF